MGGPDPTAAHTLVLASRNPHKHRELVRLLRPAGIAVQSLDRSVVLPAENGTTFAENALAKAHAAAAATGRTAIGEDSGIAAAALGGAPGVRSARYAGPHASDAQNLSKLLRALPAGSALEYLCALAWVDPRRGEERVFRGSCTGRLAAIPRGVGGFGYDPAFLPDEVAQDRTMAELTDEHKDAISHRSRAAQALVAWLRA